MSRLQLWLHRSLSMDGVKLCRHVILILLLVASLNALALSPHTHGKRAHDKTPAYHSELGRVMTWASLVTRIAATSKSQIASDCNRNSQKSLQLRKHPLKPTLWTRDPPVLRGFCSVSEASHRSGKHPEIVATTGCDSESQRFFGPNAIFVIATLRCYCDFCGKS